MTNRKGKFKVKNGSGSYDQVMLETQLGQVLDSPIKSLERNTYYEQNDVVAEQTCKGAFLVCVEGGTTDASLPPYSGALEGAPVIDGTAIFTVHRFNNLANTDAITAHDALETAHPSLDFIKSMSAASDGIHYRTRNENRIRFLILSTSSRQHFLREQYRAAIPDLWLLCFPVLCIRSRRFPVNLTGGKHQKIALKHCLPA